MLFLKVILILTFLFIFYQDIKDRQVFWFLFPLVGVLSGYLMFNNIYDEFLLMTIAINLLVVIFMLSIVFMYSRYKLKTSLNKTLGLGDVLLFLALAFSFSSISFIVLFVFGLVFSLILHLILKQKSKLQTVPLAGYLSLFFAISYLAYWTGFLPTLYIL